MLKQLVFLCVALSPLPGHSIEFMKDYLKYGDEKPLPTVANDFIYGDGSTELTTQLSDYENIVQNVPIQGSLFITHDANNKIDETSFQIGNKPLKVTFIQTTTMSSFSNLVVSVYSFQLPGMSIGTYTMPAISVKVAGKEVQALPLVIEVAR